ncbi:hypothetical protein [Streptomyces sp. SYSU K217416]
MTLPQQRILTTWRPDEQGAGHFLRIDGVARTGSDTPKHAQIAGNWLTVRWNPGREVPDARPNGVGAEKSTQAIES